MVGSHKESYGESDDRVVAPAIEDRCKHFCTVGIPFTVVSLKIDVMFIYFILLLYNSSWGIIL